MPGSTILPKPVGGRPSHPWAGIVIPILMRDLKRARIVDIHRACVERIGKPISQTTLKKYCDLLAEEGLLMRDIEIDNRDQAGVKRRWQMVWYISL